MPSPPPPPLKPLKASVIDDQECYVHEGECDPDPSKRYVFLHVDNRPEPICKTCGEEGSVEPEVQSF